MGSMKILVCIKEVLEPGGQLGIDESGLALLSEGATFRMNSYDAHALELALTFKANRPDTAVEVIAVGRPEAEKVLRRALGMGADRGIHIIPDSPLPPTSFQTAAWLAAYGRYGDYALILAGALSEDEMQGQVGPFLAEHLNLALATLVVGAELSEDGKSVVVEREREGGWRERLALILPALLTIQTGSNRPRYPSLSNMLRANRQKLHTLRGCALAAPEPRQETVGLGYPPKERAGLVLEGTPGEKARALLKLMGEKMLLDRRDPS